MLAATRTPPLPESELLSYSQEHLRYELWLFLRVGQYLVNLREPQSEQEHVLKNVLIQAFVLHLRNLIAFLYPQTVKPDDVIAGDFLQDPNTWEQIRPPISAVLDIARARSHKEIAHLTTARIAGMPPAKAWPVSDLIVQVKALMKQFADHASPQRLHPSIKELLSCL